MPACCATVFYKKTMEWEEGPSGKAKKIKIISKEDTSLIINYLCIIINLFLLRILQMAVRLQASGTKTIIKLFPQ